MISRGIRGFSRVSLVGDGFSLEDDFPEPHDEIEKASMAFPGSYCEATYTLHPVGDVWAMYTIGPHSAIWDAKDIVWDYSDPERFRYLLQVFTALRSLNK